MTKKVKVNKATSAVLMQSLFLNRGGISIEMANALKSYESKSEMALNTRLNNTLFSNLN